MKLFSKKQPALLSVVAIASFLAAVGCGSTNNGGGTGSNGSEAGSGGDPSSSNAGAAGASGGAPAVVENPPTGTDPATADPGYIPASRLNNTEYNNTVADLLGTTLRPADFFLAATVTGFDTNSRALADVSSNDVQAYFDAAKALVDDAFSNPTLKARIMTCATADATCARQIIETFGAKAWRRPLTTDEGDQLMARYTEAMTTLGKDHEGAIAHVVRILLTSAPFLYLIETDPDNQAAATAQRPLNGYELASRLSYTIWGSLPDDTLFGLAANTTLLDPVVLTEQVDRMLDDPKSSRFVERFFNQWLQIRELSGHQVDATHYPAWNDQIRAAMFADASVYFTKFVSGGLPWSQFLTTALDTSNPDLAPIYADDPPGFRSGFLGLPAFLTARSVPTRTAPTFRGKTVLDALLCTTIEVPANIMIPQLEAAAGGNVDPTNIRDMLEAHRASPDCAVCHSVLDPIGLGLENYDGIGHYRTTYEDGQAIDTSGEIQGQAFTTPAQLAQILMSDSRYAGCPSKKLTSLALRRTLRAEDKPYIDQISTAWNSGTIRDLVKQLVVNDAFRFRRLPESAL